MRLSNNTVRVVTLLLVLLAMHSSHAEMNHTSKNLRSSFEKKIKENSVYDPASQPSDVVAVSFIENKNLKFGVGMTDSQTGQLSLRNPLEEEAQDDVELKAGFTYTDPVQHKTQFYFNYSMMGSSHHPALQDKSSERDYYVDQQAKMGVKIAF